MAQAVGGLVSRCGADCGACPAYLQGLCPGCAALEAESCPVRDCADRLGSGDCRRCRASACFNFPARRARQDAVAAVLRRMALMQGRRALSRPVAGAAGPARGCHACRLRGAGQHGPRPCPVTSSTRLSQGEAASRG